MPGPGARGSLRDIPQLPCSLSALFLSLNCSPSLTVFLLLCLYGPRFPSFIDHRSLSKMPLATRPPSAFTFPERPLPPELATGWLPTGSSPPPPLQLPPSAAPAGSEGNCSGSLVGGWCTTDFARHASSHLSSPIGPDIRPFLLGAKDLCGPFRFKSVFF